jgi:serine/threonine protein kinase
VQPSAQTSSDAQCLTEQAMLDFVDRQMGLSSEGHVRAHLDVCSTCRQLVAEAAREPAPEVRCAEGDRVGRYVLGPAIGEGAMGVVYRAYDPELDRALALKLLRPDLWAEPTREAHRERMKREARAMARLSHPNVVTVYDVGTFHDHLFVAMELVEGRTLRAWLAERTRDRRDVVRVFLEAGWGLAAAHAAGLIHRDFKPDNVLIGSDGRARVTDFGLARTASPRTENVSRERTPCAGRRGSSSVAAGTPAYMAPEQFAGRSVSTQSDQFSFCVALWEALHGARPSVDETASPSERVDAVLARGLNAEPELRFESMDALLAALMRREAREESEERSARVRRAARGVMIAALGVGALVGVSLWTTRAGAPPPGPAADTPPPSPRPSAPTALAVPMAATSIAPAPDPVAPSRTPGPTLPSARPPTRRPATSALPPAAAPPSAAASVNPLDIWK